MSKHYCFRSRSSNSFHSLPFRLGSRLTMDTMGVHTSAKSAVTLYAAYQTRGRPREKLPLYTLHLRTARTHADEALYQGPGFERTRTTGVGVVALGTPNQPLRL